MSDLLSRLQAALGDRYAVERELGRGGMATVYLAYDARHGRNVAIKVLSPDLAAHVGADRFLREIQIAAKLSHPHILTLYESGQADGLVYYVMPFVEGESLRDRITRETQLSIEDAVAITCEVADALGHAHMYGVVHRDIKPENILLQGGHALLADFGIARAVDEGTSKLTATGTTVGTAAYMSPEQFMGTGVDGRSDQYSLAATLYEMLIGETPFTGPTPQTIMARATLEQVPSLQVARGAIPDELEDVVLRALEKTPADRFATMAQFRDALAQAVTGVTSGRRATMRATTRGTRSMTRLVERRRRRMKFAGAGVLFAAVVGGLVWHYVLRPPEIAAATSKKLAVLYFEDLSRNGQLGYLADGLTENLIEQLRGNNNLEVVSRYGVAPLRDATLDSAARALDAGTLVTGSVEPDGDRVKVVVRLRDGEGTELDRAKFSIKKDQLLNAPDSVAKELSALLRERVGESVRLREHREGTRNLQAWALFQRGERLRAEAQAQIVASRDSGMATLARADSLLATAARLDPKWSDPVLSRGAIALLRSRATDQDRQASAWADSALQLAEQVLRTSPRSPAALELRGSTNWVRYLRQFGSPGDEPRLLAAAEADLRQAVDLEPSRASAWATLSALSYRKLDLEQASLDAQRAYEEDAYLTSADEVVFRLFASYYDLGKSDKADRWCREGGGRFPNDWRFSQCRLWIALMPDRPPSVAEAWEAAEQTVARTPPPMRAYRTARARMLVAGVLARAGLADSAHHVIERSRIDRSQDPDGEVVADEALARLQFKTAADRAEALRLLKIVASLSPQHRAGASRNTWWYKDLENDPEFKALTGR